MHIEETQHRLSGLERRGEKEERGEKIARGMGEVTQRLQRQSMGQIRPRYIVFMYEISTEWYFLKRKLQFRWNLSYFSLDPWHTEPGIEEAFKNTCRIHKQLTGWIISRWEKLRWRKRCVIKGLEARALKRVPGLRFSSHWEHRQLSRWSWENYLTCLNLSFLCHAGSMTVISTSQRADTMHREDLAQCLAKMINKNPTINH